MKKSFVKLISIIMSLLLIYSVIPYSAFAEGTPTAASGEAVYLRPSSNWLADGARFAIYTWNDNGDQWIDMADTDADGVYEAVLPAGNTNVIFCRMNSTNATNSWDTKWNQTGNLIFSAEKPLYKVPEGAWDDSDNSNWTTFDVVKPTEAPTSAPTENTSTSESGAIHASTLTVEAGKEYTYNFTLKVAEKLFNGEGFLTYDGTVLQLKTFELKNVNDPIENIDLTNLIRFNFSNIQNLSDFTTEKDFITVTFTALKSTKTTVVLNFIELNGINSTIGYDVPFVTDSKVVGTYTVNCTTSVCDPNATEPSTEAPTDAPTEAPTEAPTVAPAEYINIYFQNNWLWSDVSAHYWGSASASTEWPGNAMEYYGNDGTYDIYTIKVPADITGLVINGTKDDGSGTDQTPDITEGWYDGICYSMTWADGNQVVSDHIDNVMNSEPATEEPTEAPTEAPTERPTEAPTEKPTEAPTEAPTAKPTEAPTAKPTEAPTEPAPKQYSLVGYIDGANVGCEDDYTSNPYVFVNDKVTVTFAKESYVFVKTTDNANWYMANDYCLDTTCTLYNTSTGAEEKMRVPAGEVTFTLVENGNDTVTLSYEVAPSNKNVTIKFAVPNGVYDSYKWTAPALTYSTKYSTNTADFTQIPLTKTDEVFYANSTGQCTLITTGAWEIYQVVLTPEQQAIINDAYSVGFAGDANFFSRTTITTNVLKAGIDGYTAYSTKKTLSELDGHTFIITDATYGAKSNSSFVGYWASGLTTIRGTAVLSGNAYSNWDAMSLYYGSSRTIDENTSIAMVDTGERTKVEDIGTIQTAITGRWSIYAVTLNPVEVAAVESATYVGFRKTDATNRTLIITNILKAPLDYYEGDYEISKKTLADVEDRVYVICDNTYTGTSVISYVGAWESEAIYTQGQDDKITLYFAAPIGSTGYSYYTWGTDVDLYYSNYGDYATSNRISMTFTGEYYDAPEVSGATRITSGQWPILKAELTVDQMAEIQNSYYVGFIKAGGKFRTKYSAGRNVIRAPKTEFTGTYGNKNSIDSLDGYTFVIQGVAPDGFESDCYIGSWVAGDAI